jgi:thiol-disulfide isomerase/thioredoxin
MPETLDKPTLDKPTPDNFTPDITLDRPTESTAKLVLDEVLGAYRAESGRTLLELTQESPVLLLFLRHFGCSFCRETLDRVSQIRSKLEVKGVRPVFVHLATPERAKPYFDYYHLSDVERVSNPDASLYRNPVFGLGRTNPFSHFLRPTVVKAWLTGAIRSYGIGLIKEDGEQMPGVFYLRDRKIANFYRYRTIADRVDYLALAAT